MKISKTLRKSDILTWAPLFVDPPGRVSRCRCENEPLVMQAWEPYKEKGGKLDCEIGMSITNGRPGSDNRLAINKLINGMVITTRNDLCLPLLNSFSFKNLRQLVEMSQAYGYFVGLTWVINSHLSFRISKGHLNSRRRISIAMQERTELTHSRSHSTRERQLMQWTKNERRQWVRFFLLSSTAPFKVCSRLVLN